MNRPFNQPHNSRWPDLDRRRPDNMSFPEWAEEQTRRSHNEHGPWISGEQIAEDFEPVLKAAAAREERRRRAPKREGKAGDPGD